MKKKLISAVLAALLLFLPMTGALAEDVAVLRDTAFIVGDVAYYSGSVDGTKQGLFELKTDGSGSTLLKETEDLILAYQDGKLLLSNWNDSKMSVLDVKTGTEKTIAMNPGAAIAANGMFYVSNYAISADGETTEALFPIDSEDEFWMITPLFVADGYLYYLDQREYGDAIIEFTNAAALYRVSLDSRETTKLVDAGADYIGHDDQNIYFNRVNFWYMDEESQQEMETQFETGLFRIAMDGANETKLVDYGPASETVYTSFSLMQDGVLYGLKSDFSSEDQVITSLVRVSTDGTAQPDVEIGEGTIHAVRDNMMIFSRFGYVEDVEYRQVDKLFAIDLTDMSMKELNPEGSYALYFSEAEPSVLLYGDKVFFQSYDAEKGGIGLYVANLDGSGVTQLATGALLQEAEDEAVG